MKTFKIKSKKIVISDPIFKRDNWCSAEISDVKSGLWTANVEYTKRKDFITQLYAWNVNAGIEDLNILKRINSAPPLPYVCGGKSGLIGYFDANSYYGGLSPDDEGIEIRDKIVEFYEKCSQEVSKEEMWGVIGDGVVSHSGYGDGTFITKGLKNDKGEYIGFLTEFISTAIDLSDDGGDDEDDEGEDL